MNTYKFTNLTGQLGKRHPEYNTALEISYVDAMERKSIFIQPNQSTYFVTASLPISVHRLRVKGLLGVNEVSPKEMEKEQKAQTSKKPVAAKPKAVKKKVEEVKTEPQKRSYTKKTTSTQTTTKKES